MTEENFEAEMLIMITRGGREIQFLNTGICQDIRRRMKIASAFTSSLNSPSPPLVIFDAAFQHRRSCSRSTVALGDHVKGASYPRFVGKRRRIDHDDTANRVSAI